LHWQGSPSPLWSVYRENHAVGVRLPFSPVWTILSPFRLYPPVDSIRVKVQATFIFINTPRKNSSLSSHVQNLILAPFTSAHLGQYIVYSPMNEIHVTDSVWSPSPSYKVPVHTHENRATQVKLNVIKIFLVYFTCYIYIEVVITHFTDKILTSCHEK
jgi:hypothetical protein